MEKIADWFEVREIDVHGLAVVACAVLFALVCLVFVWGPLGLTWAHIAAGAVVFVAWVVLCV